MITKCGNTGDYINHFRCLTSDIENNKHITTDGKIDNVPLSNGDELYVFEGTEKGATYIYDEENELWILQ